MPFYLIPVFLPVISGFESIIWCHWNDAFFFFQGPHPAVDPDIAFDFLQIIIQPFFQTEHFFFLDLCLVQELKEPIFLFVLILQILLQQG